MNLIGVYIVQRSQTLQPLIYLANNFSSYANIILPYCKEYEVEFARGMFRQLKTKSRWTFFFLIWYLTYLFMLRGIFLYCVWKITTLKKYSNYIIEFYICLLEQVSINVCKQVLVSYR